MLTLSIVTPHRRVVGPVNVSSVTVPGTNGEMTILPGHARLVSTMDTGILAFEQQDGKKEVAAVSDGFIEVSSDKVIVLAEVLELSREIDVDVARAKKEEAEAKLQAKDNFENDMERWQRQLQYSLIQLQAAEYLLPPH